MLAIRFAILLSLAVLFSPFSAYAEDDAGTVAAKIVKQAWKLQKADKDDEADELLRDAAATCAERVKQQPDDAQARFAFAQLQFELDEEIAAKENLATALAAQPNCAAMHAFQGYMHAFADEFAAAETAYRKALTLNPQDIGTRMALVGCLSKLRRDDEAVVVARETMCMWPKDVSAVIAYAGLLNNAGKTEDSKRVLEAAVAANPKEVQLREILAMMLFSHQRYRDAYAQRVEIAKLTPDVVDNEIKLLMFATSGNMEAEVRRHIDRLYELRSTGKYTKQYFPREIFASNLKMVMSLEYFDPGSEAGVKYEFAMLDKNEKLECRIVVWTEEKVNEHLRSLGKLKATERAYLLGAIRDGEQQDFGIHPSLPTYEQARALAIEIIEGKRQPKAQNAKTEPITPIVR